MSNFQAAFLVIDLLYNKQKKLKYEMVKLIATALKSVLKLVKLQSLVAKC